MEGRVEGEGRGRPGRSQRLGAGGSKEGWRRGGDLPLSSRSVWRFRGRWGGGRARGPAAEEKQNSHHVFFIRGLSERAAHPPLPCGVCACTWRAGAEWAARVHSHAFFNLPSSSVQVRARDPGLLLFIFQKVRPFIPQPPFFPCAAHTRDQTTTPNKRESPSPTGHEDFTPGPCFASSPLKTGPDAENRFILAGPTCLIPSSL